jgi:hypothetical protein
MLNIIEEFIEESRKKELDTEPLEELYNRLLLGQDVEDEIEAMMASMLESLEPKLPYMTSTYSWARKHEYLPKPIETDVGKAYALPDRFASITLKSEPQEKEFEGLDYQESLEKEGEEVDSGGRASKPIRLDNYPDLWMHDGLCGVGVDVASTGNDSTTIAVRQGMHLIDLLVYPHSDIMEAVGHVIEILKDYRPSYCNIDGTGGWGMGVISRLLELEMDSLCEINTVEFQASPVDTRLKAENVRAEMYLNLQDLFRRGLVSLPPADEETCRELVYIRYEITPRNTFKIVDKKIIRKELGHSPDRSDAIALSYYRPQRMFVYF